jgi:DNA (cytosine-5)-methyltransferase 1
VAVIEWNQWACDTIRQNKHRGVRPVSEWPLIQGDVREFDFSDLDSPIDLVSGGPPCQPFSLGGKHRGPLDKRDMFPQAIRAVRELRPRAFLIENVKGLTRSTFARYLEYICLQLKHPEVTALADEPWNDHLVRLDRHDTAGRVKGLHYKVVRKVLNAANFGVPQKRERVFIVGFRGDLGMEWRPPCETHSEAALLWAQWRSNDYWDGHSVSARERLEGGKGRAIAPKLGELPRLKRWLTVRDALKGLPDPELNPREAARFANHRFVPGARSYPGHTGSPLDEPAKTLKAGDHGVPGGENMLRRPDGSIRYFTVRESARLQTFPDDYLFHGSWTETMRQLGNAVPVALATVVAQGIRCQLEATTRQEAAPGIRSNTTVSSVDAERAQGETRQRIDHRDPARCVG